MVQADTMTRREIRQVLQRHKGSIAAIQRELGLKSHVSISLWLKNKTNSQRVAEAANRKALELIEQEKRNAPAA